MEKTHQLPINDMTKERRLRRLGHAAHHSPFCYEDTRTCAACWAALWHLDVLCYEGCEGYGTANGLPQPIMELAERRHNVLFWVRNFAAVKMF